MVDIDRHLDDTSLILPIAERNTDASPVYRIVSGLFVVAAAVFAGAGLYTVYNNSYDSRIVGGDAYNFIIYATRGTALVCTGIVCAVLSVTFAIFAHMERSK